ncbi:MAG: acyltransferase family protein [Anaerolineae bacterium]|jgi:surface polysaccharide O-acyltransferase-like enzyme|nr:acyltransferase family protein [Anaerolineae bacterium]
MGAIALPRATAAGGAPAKTRLHYLDWLRVISILAVFLVHVSDVFNTVTFEIKNAEQSLAITIVQGFAFPWGMPLFFLIAGAGSYFALRHRSAGAFTRERTLRLLVPFLTGTLLLGPIQIYLSWQHRIATGVTAQSLGQFVAERFLQIGPKWFGAIGYHMWFLGYLFAFSLLALPIFLWLRSEAGRRFVVRLAAFCEHRGGILIFVVPLVIVRLLLQPFFPVQHDWADFVAYGLFFILGFLLYTDQRFTVAIRRDWGILLAVLLLTSLAYGYLAMSLGFDLEKRPATFPAFLVWALIMIAGWCGTSLMLFVGMRFLDFTNRGLRYSLDVLLPFFVLHQPVIIVLAYFVVQWSIGLLPKMLILGVSSFAITLALVQFVIKRVPVLRILFGMKPAEIEPQAQPALAP